MTEDIEKLLELGRMDLEAGYPKYAREYFEKALELDASNREAMRLLARANEILSRKEAMVTAVEPVQDEPVEPPHKIKRKRSIPAKEKKERGRSAIQWEGVTMKAMETIMKWFQRSFLRMHMTLTFVWCLTIFSIVLLLTAQGDPTLSITSAIGMSLFYSIGATIYMLVLSIEPIATWDENWRKALVEGRLPSWMGWIRLILVVLPSYVYGWVPQKAYDWYFHKFSGLEVGLRLLEEGRHREAVAELEQYKIPESSIEENYVRYLALGNCYEGIEELNKAVSAYQQAVNFKPGAVGAQTRLAQAYVLNNQYNEGLALLRELHDQFPEDIDILGLMARAYITLEMYEDAFKYLKKALSLKPMEPALHKLLAEVCLDTGMNKEAIESANKALSLNLPSPIAEEARRIIEIAKRRQGS